MQGETEYWFDIPADFTLIRESVKRIEGGVIEYCGFSLKLPWQIVSYAEYHYNNPDRGVLHYPSGTLPTRYTYTRQYSYASDFGLVFYGSRFYDPLLARWASPDSIIPSQTNPLS